MTPFSVIIALVLEQYRPLPAQRWVYGPLKRFFAFLDGQFNDGQYKHGIVAWAFGVALPVLALGIANFLLADRYLLIDIVLTVGTLYLTMGFRQFSHNFTDVQMALRAGELDRARRLLADWRGQNGKFTADRLSSSEIARLSMEQALIASHRHVFAPLIWFGFFGPAGALLYRLALFASDYWKTGQGDLKAAPFGRFAQRAFYVIDWVPLRLTAIGFAVTGDFEGAVFCWRTQAAGWPEPEQGILLSSGAGALGVRLGLPLQDGYGVVEDRPEMGLGDDADADFMQSTIGLVWRTLVLCLLLMSLVWVASWVG